MLTRFARHVLLLGLFFTPLLAAAATPQDAMALLDEAVAYYQANGKEATFAEINKPDGTLRRGGLYIFVYDGNGTVVAHGAYPTRVGKNRMEQQDANGKFFAKEIMKVQKSGESVDYVWLNPETGKVQPKTTYIYLVDEYRFGCGIYK
jgi:cytochrome c